MFQRIKTIIRARSSRVECFIVLWGGGMNWGRRVRAYISYRWRGFGTWTLEVGIGCESAHYCGGGDWMWFGGVTWLRAFGETRRVEKLDRGRYCNDNSSPWQFCLRPRHGTTKVWKFTSQYHTSDDQLWCKLLKMSYPTARIPSLGAGLCSFEAWMLFPSMAAFTCHFMFIMHLSYGLSLDSIGLFLESPPKLLTKPRCCVTINVAESSYREQQKHPKKA